LEGITKCELA